MSDNVPRAPKVRGDPIAAIPGGKGKLGLGPPLRPAAQSAAAKRAIKPDTAVRATFLRLTTCFSTRFHER